jgi:methylated-DNA-[protein]-cysteine S-methyltransferase
MTVDDPTSADELTPDLEQALPVSPGDLRVLHDQLAAAAQGEGLLDVAYRTLDTPIGSLLVAATDEGLVRVAFATEGHDATLQALADRVSPRLLEAPARLDGVAAQLDEYFAGRRRRFDLALDWRLSSGFRSTVLHRLAADVAYGETASYATLARLAGSPRAVRAVGTACATNPLPVVVPCHRVVRADGSVGGYLGGAAAKRALLALEAA